MKKLPLVDDGAFVGRGVGKPEGETVGDGETRTGITDGSRSGTAEMIVMSTRFIRDR